MNNTTYTANENCFLIDGEVYLINKISLVNLKNNCSRNPVLRTLTIGEVTSLYIWFGNVAFIVTHSTKPLDGVIHLNREWFVKGEDVDGLAHIYANDTYIWPLNKSGERVSLPPGQTTPPNYNKHCKISERCFKAGYNANTKEFSYDFVINAISLARSTNMMADEIIDGLHPLSLPASLEINEQGEIVNVIW